jgi:Tfp pilus assembly protein PilX
MRMEVGCQGRARQRGVTMFGLLFWAIVVGFVALIGMRVLPTLNEYFTIQRAVNKIAAEGATTVP